MAECGSDIRIDDLAAEKFITKFINLFPISVIHERFHRFGRFFGQSAKDEIGICNFELRVGGAFHAVKMVFMLRPFKGEYHESRNACRG